jgi:molybdopterin synthase catalytic subunit
MNGRTDENRDDGHVVAISESPVDAGNVIASVSGPDAGAVAVFLGTVRGASGGKRTLFLEYEAYRPMAEKTLRGIASAVAAEIGPCRVAIVHRVGRLEIGEISIAIAVASAHRRVALAACAECIERVKKTLPVWKKEHFEDGAVWIEGDPSAPEPGRGGTSVRLAGGPASGKDGSK